MSNNRKRKSNKPKMATTSNPRKFGGSIAGPGDSHSVGQFIIDTTNAVLMDEVTVSTIDDYDGHGSSIIAMLLGGRVNHSTDRAEVMFLFGTDGIAAIVTELLALMGRATGVDHMEILDDIFTRIAKLRESGDTN